jgi:hypothetical protein
MGHAYYLKKQMYLNIEGTFLQKKCSLSLSLLSLSLSEAVCLSACLGCLAWVEESLTKATILKKKKHSQTVGVPIVTKKALFILVLVLSTFKVINIWFVTF